MIATGDICSPLMRFVRVRRNYSVNGLLKTFCVKTTYTYTPEALDNITQDDCGQAKFIAMILISIISNVNR